MLTNRWATDVNRAKCFVLLKTAVSKPRKSAVVENGSTVLGCIRGRDFPLRLPAMKPQNAYCNVALLNQIHQSKLLKKTLSV